MVCTYCLCLTVRLGVVLQKRVKLRQEQGDLLINKRNQYLLNIGFHSAALARLQGQLMALDPTPRESLGASAYISWAEGARLLQETVEEIHLQHIKMHFELYHGSQVGLLALNYEPDCGMPCISRVLCARSSWSHNIGVWLLSCRSPCRVPIVLEAWKRCELLNPSKKLANSCVH